MQMSEASNPRDGHEPDKWLFMEVYGSWESYKP